MLPANLNLPITFTLRIKCPLPPNSKPTSGSVLASDALKAHLEVMERSPMDPEAAVKNVRTLADLCADLQRALQVEADQAAAPAT